MSAIEQLELPLWAVLKEAAIAPDAADVGQLLAVLDECLLSLETIGQLQVAAEAIAQITQVVCDRSTFMFEELEATASEDGPTMPVDAFDRYVRQTMEVDFDQFIEPIAALPRKTSIPSSDPDAGQSVVGELDQTALLKALDEQMNQEPGLTDIEAFNRAIEVAHGEDISAWSQAIAQWINQQSIREVSLLQLQQAIDLPLVPLWLALLLGGYCLQQRGEFYEGEQIWVQMR